jgi:hypothetical protein
MPIIQNIHSVLTADDFYDLWLRLCTPYRKAQFDGRPHAEIPFRASAAQMARVMQRVHELHESVFTCSATGPQKATGTVEIEWTLGTTDIQGIREGQILFETPWGPRYRSTEDFEVGAGAPANTTVIIGIAAEWTGFLWNVAERDLSRWAVPLPESCDEFGGITWSDDTTDAGKIEFLDGIADGSITLAAQDDLTGGAIGTLDLIATEKGLPRAEDESDVQLRRRVKRLPLTVTRTNIMLAVNEELAEFNVEATMVEWFESGWVIGEGVIGDDHFSGPPSFCIVVPNLEALLVDEGFVINDGIISEDHIGDDTSLLDGLLGSLQEIVDRAKLGGVCGVVVMED